MYVRVVQQSADKSKRFSSQNLRSFQAFSKRTSRPFFSASFPSELCEYSVKGETTLKHKISFL